MSFVQCILAIWPGFTGLLKYGRWTYLAVAVAFALFLDIVLFINFYWSSFLSPGTSKYTWLGLAVAWITLSFMSARFSKCFEATRRLDARGELFLEVLNHYLRGEWEKTECCANAILRYNQHDVEVLLLLATLYRHTRRLNLAQETLARLELLENADKWFFEICIEKKRINELLHPDEINDDSLIPLPDSCAAEEPCEHVVPFCQTQVG